MPSPSPIRPQYGFEENALRWYRSGDPSSLVAMLRSPRSGVAHDVAAAYAALAARAGPLLEAVESQRLGVAPAQREATLRFAGSVRRCAALACELDDTALFDAVTAAFPPTPHPCPPAGDGGGDIALAEAVEPETGGGVSARQRHFSASSLNAYAECPRKWFYRYACAAIEDPGSAASAYGTAFHLALEDFHGEFPRPHESDEAPMRQRVAQCVTWAFERTRDGFDAQVEFELQRRRAQRTAQRYVDWLIAQARKSPFEVIGREVAVELDLGGYAFVGYIDRLDRDERSQDVGVVDYKTGTISASANEYREKIRRFGDFQLPFYYWARTAAGDRVTRLALLPLKDALLEVRPIVLEVVLGPVTQTRGGSAPFGTISVADLERARARMIELCAELSSGSLRTFAVTDDAAACTYCAYASACARKPPPPPERFAR